MEDYGYENQQPDNEADDNYQQVRCYKVLRAYKII